MKNRIIVVAALIGMFLTPIGAGAQVSSITLPGGFEDGSEIQCFSLPEEEQWPSCWIYNSSDKSFGFYHSTGEGPTAFWPVEDFRDLSVSDNGHLAIVSTSHSVEVLNLERPKRNRLTGITTPRRRFMYDGIKGEVVSATMAGNNLIILLKDRREIVPMSLNFPGRVLWLPYVGSQKQVLATATYPPPTLRPTGLIPTVVATEEPPEEPPVGPPDTPEPEFPTPVVVWPATMPPPLP